jgi:hypothetical protein
VTATEWTWLIVGALVGFEAVRQTVLVVRTARRERRFTEETRQREERLTREARERQRQNGTR